MNLLFSCIGKRGYIAKFFRDVLGPDDRIIGTSNSRWTSGFRYCDRARLMPDIASASYPDAVLQLCRDERIDAALSFFDPDVYRLSHFRAEFLALGVTPILPREPVARLCFDKFLSFQHLQAHGFRTPATYIDYGEIQAALQAGGLSFPLIVKPRTGFGSSHTYVARDERQLDVFFHIGPEMIVQPRVSGADYDFDICNDLQEQPVSVVLWRKLKSTMGETENVITVKDDKLLALGNRLGRAISHVGPMDVDMFVDDRGEATIIEMNPRFGGGYPVSHLAGADFPRLLLRMIRGEQVAPQIGAYRENTVMMKSLEVFGGQQAEFFERQLHLPTKDAIGPVDL